LISLGLGPKLNYPEKVSLVNQFQKNVEKYPNNFALCDAQKQLSYREVDRQSTNLAHALNDANVKQGDFVGIFLDANYLFFIAELAILKIGAIFIPLSKDNPNERLQLIINQAKINFFIVDDNRKGLFDTSAQKRQLISIDSASNSTNLDKKLPELDKNTDEFCVLYTSGSTGAPKGVILLQKGIFRVVESPNFIKISAGDKIAQTANQAFDAAQLECWLAWNHGASLVLFNKETLLNISSFQAKLRTEKITHMWLTAGLFDSYANTQPDIFATKHLKTLMVGGDVVYIDTVSKVLNFTDAPTILNGYGPTEGSIFLSTHTFNKQTINNYNTAPIGSPINNTTVSINTFLGELAPKGAIGELLIRGEGVAKGYLNSALNKDRFTGDLDNKSYHTGDLVKYNTEDSQIMFIRRVDTQQVKINGNLVALEEIRSCLSRHPDIKQVEVSVIEKQIVAFYTLKSSNKKFIPNEEFQKYLSKSLPDYMFPKFYKKVDYFEVNSNGKLDKTQFKKFEKEFRTKQQEVSPPQTSDGKALLKIIEEELPLFPNNINENFINFGCDSLTVMRIINRVNLKFKPEMKKPFDGKHDNPLTEKFFHASDLYKNPTIQGLKKILSKKLNNKHKSGSLRILKSGDSHYPPIIFIHPAGGGLSCFDNLVRQLKLANFCYGIDDPLLESNQLELLSMEEMAKNYLAIIANEVEGPFILAGYSFGGMLGLEMAAQYESRSENAHLLQVILFDTWMVSYANEEIKEKLKKEVLVYCAEQRKEANLKENSDMLGLLEKLCEHHQEIGFKFKPQESISIPVYLFKAMIFNEQFKKMHSQDKNNYLSTHVKKLMIKEIRATHFNMFENQIDNSLVNDFSILVNEINGKKCFNKHHKLYEVDGPLLFRPLSEVNDPKLSSYQPKVK
jgi:amino acid adenylation domain-containing protein